MQDKISDAEVIEMARRVCLERSMPFSVNAANPLLGDLGELEGADGGTQALAAVGRHAGLRFSEVTGSLRDLQLAAQEVPPLIVARQGADGQSAGFFLILRIARGRFVVNVEGQQKKVSSRWIRKHAATTETGALRWFVARPALAAETASSYDWQAGTSGSPLPPLRRLFALLRPEMRDIRTVFVFAVFVGLLSLTTPLAVEALVNTIAFGRYLQPLVVLSLMVFVFLAFRAGLGVVMTVVVEVLQRRLFVRVVDDVAHRLTQLRRDALGGRHGPELVNRFFDVVSVQKITSKLLLESLMLILQTIIGLTVLAFYHPFLLGYDIILLAMMGIVLLVLGRGAVKTARLESNSKYKTAAWLQEVARHPSIFRFNGGHQFAINRADELSAKYIQERREHFRILVRQVTFSMLMQAFAATVLLGLGGYLVIQGQMTLGQLVAAELIVTVILGSFAQIGKDLESYYDLLASVDKLGQLFDLPVESTDKTQLPAEPGPATIELVNLTFSSTSSKTLSHRFAQGETTAVLGPSGTGKSQLMEMIAGLREPLSGHVLLNGFRVDRAGLESLQSQLAVVSEIEIFEGSIEENLRLGRRYINSLDINGMVELIGLQPAITRLEESYQTRLTISGKPLSSGEAVRLVLARALLAKPAALLIDGLLDRLSDDDLRDVLMRLDEFKSSSTIIIATGRKAIAAWAREAIDLGTSGGNGKL